jgi:hypothetical protein
VVQPNPTHDKFEMGPDDAALRKRGGRREQAIRIVCQACQRRGVAVPTNVRAMSLMELCRVLADVERGAWKGGAESGGERLESLDLFERQADHPADSQD